jgi:hypothetical protein
MSELFQVAAAPQFIVVPFTGLQISRRVPLPHINSLPSDEQRRIFEGVKLACERNRKLNQLTQIISSHIACDHNGIESTGWLACNQNDGVFYRLIKVGGNSIAADLVIDTQTGPGRTTLNKVVCGIEIGNVFRKSQYTLATIFTENNSKPKNVLGSFVMDFGNSGTSCIFAPDDWKAKDVRPILLHNPLDPYDGFPEVRPVSSKTIVKSSAFLLTVPDSQHVSPWVESDPLVTAFYAPKKYVRFWPENLKDKEPTVPFRGVLGQRTGLFPAIQFVQHALDSILQAAVSSITNPKFSSISPDLYPQIGRILLTYPLTWREEDKSCFKEMIRSISDKLFVLPDKIRDHFRIDFICSEPVAVAAYAIWETFLHFYHMAPNGVLLESPSLASSQLGNLEGSQELRILVVDIGGGSSDIALIDTTWNVLKGSDSQDGNVDVSFHLEESLRFNRAGDRISHLIATAIWVYFSEKYKISEVLDFKTQSANHSFTLQMKRQAVSKINMLVEEAKRVLASVNEVDGSQVSVWKLKEEAEDELKRYLSPVISQSESASQTGFSISLGVLQKWIEADLGSAKTRGEPGLMDIFYYLQELGMSLRSGDRMPHLVLLSGRTTRLPFFKTMTASYLGIPLHRVRTLGEMVPDSLKSPDHEDMDKLAVVYGAHRFKYGSPINFRYLKTASDNCFHRFLGTVTNTPQGIRLNRIIVKPGDTAPRTCKMKIGPNSSILIGHSFRADGRVEVLANIQNSGSVEGEVEFDLVDDFHVEKKPLPNSESITVDEWVPGGTTNIVDNFNDTGRIDCEPDGFLKSIVVRNRLDWIQ